jgi:hypothetical protein
MESDKLKEHCASVTSKILASYVVVFRLLDINKELAIFSMEELDRRRIAGDDFDYESYIDEELKNSPPSKLGPKEKMNFGQIFKSINSMMGKNGK